MMDVSNKKLSEGVNLHIISKENLKTTFCKVFLHWPLDKDTAHLALLPKVLRRGSQKYSNMLEISRKLEEMFGASFATAVHKKGERQLIEFRLETVSEEFLLEEDKKVASFEKALDFLYEMIFNPLLENEKFIDRYVEEEKQNHLDRIDSQQDDKMSYAVERLVSNMCEDEPFAVNKLGGKKETEEITPDSLYKRYIELLNRAPIDIFVLGNLRSSKEAIEKIEQYLPFKSRKDIPQFPTTVEKQVSQVNSISEQEPINQSKLCMGFRTQVSYRDPEVFSLMVLNAMFGGFSHSRLFKVVREEHSLCYYVFARLEKTKGIMVVNAGIDSSDYEQTVELVNQELNSLKSGDISDEELSLSKSALQSSIRQAEDNPDATSELVLEGLINSNVCSPEEIRKRISEVSKDDVIKVADNVVLDTIYFMKEHQKEKVGV